MFSAIPQTIKLILIGVGVLILGIIIFLIYRSGKKAGGTEVNLSAGNSDTGGKLASETELKQLAQEMYNDMAGLNPFGSHTIPTYERVLSLSDADLSRLYNIYNLAYQKESGESLVEWVKSEKASPLSPWETVKGTLLNRFAKLNFI